MPGGDLMISFYNAYFGVERLSLNEIKSLLYLIKTIRVQQPIKPNTYRIVISDLSRSLGHKRVKYTELKETLFSLQNKTCSLPIGELLIDYPLILEAVDSQSGAIQLKLEPLVIGFLSKIHKMVNDSEIAILLTMKSLYSIMFYILFKDLIWSGDQLSIDEIRTLLAIGDRYPQYGNIRDKILIPVQAELKATAGIKLELTEHKIKTRVTSITFTVSRLYSHLHLNDNADYTYLLVSEELKEYGVKLTPQQFAAWHPFGDYAIQAAILQVKNNAGVKNALSYIHHLLKERVYGVPLNNVSSQTFTCLYSYLEAHRGNTSIPSDVWLEPHFKRHLESMGVDKSMHESVWLQCRTKIIQDLNQFRNNNL